MTREEVIEALSDTRAEFNCFDPMGRRKYHALSEAIEALQGQKTGKWIPCSERLPEKEDWYIVTVKHNDTNEILTDFSYLTYKMFKISETSNCEVVAWMPFPEAYKGEQE